jgi:hypothetical protein
VGPLLVTDGEVRFSRAVLPVGVWARRSHPIRRTRHVTRCDGQPAGAGSSCERSFSDAAVNRGRRRGARMGRQCPDGTTACGHVLVS